MFCLCYLKLMRNRIEIYERITITQTIQHSDKVIQLKTLRKVPCNLSVNSDK